MRYGILNFTTEPDVERTVIDNEPIQCFNAINENDLPNSIAELEACMVWYKLKVTKTTIDRLKNCKVIVCVSVGFNNVNIEYAGSAGIAVVNVPDYGTNDVADHAFALLLAQCRKITTYNTKLKENVVSNWDVAQGGEIRRLTGAKIGIVGLGRIGTAVAMRAKAFGMDVSFYDPYKPDGYDKSLNIRRFGNLKSIFADSDYISIHTPLTAETHHIIDEKILSVAKPGITIINTARGGVVDLDSIYRGLKSDVIKAFAADVLEVEPPNKVRPCRLVGTDDLLASSSESTKVISEDTALIKAFYEKEPWIDGRVILTPHAAYYSVEGEREIREKAAKQMLNAVNGIPLRNCVNKEFLRNERSPVA
ncbi:hypothetical protein AGMMS49938_10710 [Fibrobacterales bacterium]|nr:hypothetical protein AGMMS49938_10710 [Fibrobacterales bacterium]